MNSMTTKLYCDDTIEGKGKAQVVSVTTSADGCKYTVALKHGSGCPIVKFDVDEYMGWFEEN